MVLTLDAIFDGRVFLPLQPITLTPNTRVQIAIKADEMHTVSFLDIAEALELDGPSDWSIQLLDTNAPSDTQKPRANPASLK